MSQRLPELIEPIRLAETRRILNGRISIAGMQRLKPVLYDMSGEAEVELEFGIDEAGIVNVTGKVTAIVSMLCQRCMEPMQRMVSENISLAVIRSESQTDDLPDHYEPLLVDEDGFASVTNLIEDEIILALPVSSLHELEECPARDKLDKYRIRANQDGDDRPGAKGQKDSSGSGEEVAAKANNPFAALARLKEKK